MSAKTSPQHYTKAVSAARNVFLGYSLTRTPVGPKLADGELVTGTVTVTSTPSGLTISNKAVTTASNTILGETQLAGQAISFHVAAGGSADQTYNINVQVDTDAAIPQTFNDNLELLVIADS